MIPRKKLEIPAEVSGRPVTNRGVHLQPFGHHGDWLNRWEYWVDLLVSMGMSWVVVITDGDAVRQKHHGVNPLQVLLDRGIIPIIREQRLFPYSFQEQDTLLWSVDLYGQYGLKPFWIIRNEPFDDREWFQRKLPNNAWAIIMKVWAEAAQYIVANGGYVGFPDGPCYAFNPFESIKAYDCQWMFDQGLAYYTGHHYGKNRPRDYPYDAVSRHGAQLTEEAYRRLLDDYASETTWREEPVELINQRRTKLRSPGLTALQDDTCWRGWEKVAHWSVQTFGYVVPMTMTEGGWVPRDRPGTGPDTDIRMPHTTPKMVAKKTLQMYDTPSPFFAICPWLLADEDMGGTGWPFDAWHGWAYNEKYGRKKPVVTTLQEMPPKEVQPRGELLVIDVNGDSRDWAWVRDRYSAFYRRGATTLRLIELHEYEGPPTLDVWVVDSDGLPVEGVPFYYCHPNAPATDGADEWYDRGERGTTGPDGRISFAAKEPPCMPGEGVEAIWPQGKGDVLEKLGLLKGTRNRRLNGMWQLVPEGTPLPPGPPEPEEPGQPSQPSQPAGPLPPPNSGDSSREWHMDVEYRPGPRIIAGTLPESGVAVRIADPWGNAVTVTSGSKPEHGLGGFEALASHLATYRLQFLDQAFDVPMKDGSTFVTFTIVESPLEPPVQPPTPPVEPPVVPPEPPVQPSEPPTPPVEPPVEPPEPPVEPPVVPPEPPVQPSEPPTPPVEPHEPPAEPTTPTDDNWALLFEKLARIEKLIAQLPKK